MKFEHMNMRIAISMVIVSLGAVLAFLPQNEGHRFETGPAILSERLANADLGIAPDHAARMLASGDTTIIFVDVRDTQEFREVSMPGAVNIPLDQLINGNPELLLPEDRKVIFFSNDDIKSNMALAFSSGFGCKDVYVLEGGLNKWFEMVVNSSFSGDKISARENALFETRFRARRLFSEYNSLPDSLKLAASQTGFGKKVKLDGGCE